MKKKSFKNEYNYVKVNFHGQGYFVKKKYTT